MSIGCINVNSLNEFSLIGGTNELLQFEVNYPNGDPVDLSSSTTQWTLSYLGDPDNAIITINGDIFEINKFTVVLDGEYTKNLSGKFIQQPIITTFSGEEYRFSQGIITIIPRIQNN